MVPAARDDTHLDFEEVAANETNLLVVIRQVYHLVPLISFVLWLPTELIELVLAPAVQLAALSNTQAMLVAHFHRDKLDRASNGYGDAFVSLDIFEAQLLIVIVAPHVASVFVSRISFWSLTRRSFRV